MSNASDYNRWVEGKSMRRYDPRDVTVPDDKMQEFLRRGWCPDCGLSAWLRSGSTVTVCCDFCGATFSVETPDNTTERC